MNEIISSPGMEEIAARINAMPVLKLFGALVTVTGPGEAQVEIADIRDFHTGGLETSAINGMTVMGLLDAAMCAAALSTLPGGRCATGEMSVKFKRPVLGGPVKATGRLVSRTNNMLVCEASIVDAEGKERAVATASVHAI